MKKRWVVLFVVTVIAALCATAAIVVSSGKPDDTLSTKEIEQAETVNARLEDMRTADKYISTDDTTRAEFALREIEKLADEKYIDKGSINYNEDEGIISYVLLSGVFACEKIGGFEEDVDEVACFDNLAETPNQTIDSPVTKSASDSMDNPDGLILFAMTDRTPQFNRCKEFEKSWDSAGVETSVDSTVTLDDMTNLMGYEFVYFKMHGVFYEWKYNDYWIFGYESIMTSWICLEQKQNADTDKKYDKDLINHRIGYINGKYMIAPDFFTSHYKSGDLDGDIFFLGCCELMGKDDVINEAWTNAFNNASLEAFIGFHNTNYTDYNLDLVEVFMNRLIEGDTVQTAFAASTSECGEDDETWFGICEEEHIPAYPLLRGNKSATLKRSVNPVSETTADISVNPSESTLKADEAEIFAQLAEKFLFTSGAGAWGTEVQIKQDGTFTGYYHDSNMGDTGTEYPNGTRFECLFSGKFTYVEKINDYEYSMRIEYLNLEGTVGEEKILDGIKVVTAEPYGFDNAEEFILYLPGRSTADLPQAFIACVRIPHSWAEDEIPEVLPFYGLYNVGGEEGFFMESADAEQNQPLPVQPKTQAVPDNMVEDEVLHIREVWNTYMSNIDAGNYLKSDISSGVVSYHNGTEIVTIDVNTGTNNSLYGRTYIYENGKMIFAFFYNDVEENRLYFKNDQLFGWRITTGNNEPINNDNAFDNAKFIEWEIIAREEGNRLLISATASSNIYPNAQILTGQFQGVEWGDYMHINIKGDDGVDYSFFVLQSTDIDPETLEIGQAVKVTWVNSDVFLNPPGNTINVDQVIDIELS